MQQVLVVIFSVLLLKSQAMPQVPDVEIDDDYSLTFAPTVNSISNPDPLAMAVQCLYDFKKNRVNRDCKSAKPPKCEKGDLVQTSVGEDYEMCCCNFSKFL